VITLRVDGEPAPQGSKSIVSRGGKTWMIEKSRKVEPWRAAIKAAARNGQHLRLSEPIYAGAVEVTITFTLARPRSHYGTGRNAEFVKAGAPLYPYTRPDLDKLVRSTLDGLKIAGLLGDDGQVASLTAHKRYCRDGELPGADITIEGIGGL